MPAMPRPTGKCQRIAYAILGKPTNSFDKKSRKDKEVETVVYRDQIQRLK